MVLTLWLLHYVFESCMYSHLGTKLFTTLVVKNEGPRTWKQNREKEYPSLVTSRIQSKGLQVRYPWGHISQSVHFMGTVQCCWHLQRIDERLPNSDGFIRPGDVSITSFCKLTFLPLWLRLDPLPVADKQYQYHHWSAYLWKTELCAWKVVWGSKWIMPSKVGCRKVSGWNLETTFIRS